MFDRPWYRSCVPPAITSTDERPTLPRASRSLCPISAPVFRLRTSATDTSVPLLENSVKNTEYGVPALS